MLNDMHLEWTPARRLHTSDGATWAGARGAGPPSSCPLPIPSWWSLTYILMGRMLSSNPRSKLELQLCLLFIEEAAGQRWQTDSLGQRGGENSGHTPQRLSPVSCGMHMGSERYWKTHAVSHGKSYLCPYCQRTRISNSQWLCQIYMCRPKTGSHITTKVVILYTAAQNISFLSNSRLQKTHCNTTAHVCLHLLWAARYSLAGQHS